MANVDAFNSGFDAGSGKKTSKKLKKLGGNKSGGGEGGSDDNPVAATMRFKKGGKVKKTGVAKVHKGEYVLTAKKAKKYAKKQHKKVATKR